MLTINERADLIIADIKKETSTNPIKIFKRMVSKEYINIHGPEHHILDGACLLIAYKNAHGNIDIDAALSKIRQEGLRMPGAICGLWGVCGAVTSIGAALAIIDQTGPLSTDGSWGKHMEFTSTVLSQIGKVNGPRCCKRDALIALKHAIEFINNNYPVTLEYEEHTCPYSSINSQCIKDRCPFYD